MHKKIIGIILAGILLSLFGCGGSKTLSESYMREGASVAHIRTLAVLPFIGDARAQRIRELTITHLLASGLFDVLDKGRVDSVLRREGISAGSAIDLQDIKRLGNQLNAQALLFGTVEESRDARGSASFAVITMTLRLIDTETGVLLWQASGKASGYSIADRLFGMAPKDPFAVTLNLLGELFATMQ